MVQQVQHFWHVTFELFLTRNINQRRSRSDERTRTNANYDGYRHAHQQEMGGQRRREVIRDQELREMRARRSASQQPGYPKMNN